MAGEVPDLSNDNTDFFHIERPLASSAAQTVIKICCERLPEAYNMDPLADVQVICPSKKGETGTHSLNRLLQEALNPPHKKKNEITVAGQIFREGDKIMQIKNNYNIEWETNEEKGTGIFNGDIGILKTVDPKAGVVVVDFEGKSAVIPAEYLSELELAYAVTVHKSQGSEFRAVVLPISNLVPNLAYRNLLYTAVTRARELLVTIGSSQQIHAMALNDKKAKRYSALAHFLSKE